MLRKTTRGLQGDPHLTEALTRAFMFADASVQAEIHNVGMLLTRMLTRAMHPGQTELTDDDIAIARVIGDVWLSTLVGWVTGRTSAADTAAQMEKAVHLLPARLTSQQRCARRRPRTGSRRCRPRPASSRRRAGAAGRGCGAR